MKKIAILLTHSPFAAAISREACDMIMALAAVEHQVTVIYQGAAVLQLRPMQTQAALGCKDFTPSQKLYDLYEVSSIAASATSLALYQIEPEQCLMPVMSLSDNELANLLAEQQHILRF